MALRINDTAPNFTAQTTHGPIDFHHWIDDNWAILFSHPKDFTPVCTTELGYMAKIEPEFTRRNAKLIGLSVDPVDSHSRWLGDIEETQGANVNYPIIADSDLKVSKLYNMLPAEEPGTSEGRTPGDEPDRALGLRHRPRQENQTHADLPDDHGPQFRRDSAGARLDAAHRQAQGLHSRRTGSRAKTSSFRARSPTKTPKKLFPAGWKAPKPYMRIVKQPT